MVLKRHSREGGEGSDFSNRPKRPYPILRDVSKHSLQELVSMLEIPLRNWVRQEVEHGINSYVRSSQNHIEASPSSRIFQLHFEEKLPTTLFTSCRVETEDGATIRVVLRDARSRKIIRSGPHSSAKVTLCVLDGDFNKEDREDWSPQEFIHRKVQQREGKRPLVTGTLVLTLKDGVGYVEDVSFTDNSSWTRSGKFRLGAITGEGNMIREGISNIFKVKDHRGESYKKHDQPSLGDHVWRLKKIAKDGASHKRLTDYGIVNVRGFLRLYVTDPALLRQILGSKISDKAWSTIVAHATACLLDENDLYQFKAVDGYMLVLNSIYQVDGVIFDGEHYLPFDMLSATQKLAVENWKRMVYNNLNGVFPIDEHSLLVRQTQLLHMNSYSNPSIGYVPPENINFPVEQDQLELQFNPHNVQVSPSPTYGVEEGNQFRVCVAETSPQIRASNSFLSNGLISSDSYDEFPGDGYNWGATSSLGPLGLTDPFAANENFQVETSPWQGNSLFEYQGDPALGIVSSNIGIRISSNGKSKASWCKIRAVIKFQMIKSSCQKYGKASKYTF